MARRGAKLSEMDEQRALLDSLMGVNRNQDRAEEVVSDYRDERVCKYYLHGVCPSELFNNTRTDVGPCALQHSDEMKEAFERDLKNNVRGTHLAMFDAEMERKLSLLVTDADRKISRERAKQEEAGNERTDPEMQPEVLSLTVDIEHQCDLIEKLGEAGDVDSARRYFDELEDMEEERRDVLRRHSANRFLAVQSVQRLKVCHICGSNLSLSDGDSRIADHFQGKQHEGYKLIRLFLDKMAARRGQGQGQGQGQGPRYDRERDERHDRGDRGDRDRERDRAPAGRGDRYDPYRDDRYGGRDRDQGYQRRDSRDRDRNRDRDRGGRDGRSDHRERDRSRDRDRDRGRGGRY